MTKLTFTEIVDKINTDESHSLRTDKAPDWAYFDRGHAYSYLYNFLFTSIRESAQHILEIGTGQGGSALAFAKYFENATITTVDNFKPDGIIPKSHHGKYANVNALECYEQIRVIQADAYKDKTLEELSDRKYDMIIDDGPHTIASQIKCMQMYPALLTDNGILVVEDIAGMTNAKRIVNAVPPGVIHRTMIICRDYVSSMGDEYNVVLFEGSKPFVRPDAGDNNGNL